MYQAWHSCITTHIVYTALCDNWVWGAEEFQSSGIRPCELRIVMACGLPLGRTLQPLRNLFGTPSTAAKWFVRNTNQLLDAMPQTRVRNHSHNLLVISQTSVFIKVIRYVPWGLQRRCTYAMQAQKGWSLHCSKWKQAQSTCEKMWNRQQSRLVYLLNKCNLASIADCSAASGSKAFMLSSTAFLLCHNSMTHTWVTCEQGARQVGRWQCRPVQWCVGF